MIRGVPIVVLAVAASLATASTASAVSLSTGTDQSVYSVGQDITVTLLGDTTGAPGGFLSALVVVEYDELLVTAPATATQTTITSFGGVQPWFVAPRPCTPSSCNAFDQVTGGNPLPPDPDIEVGTLVLTAVAPGVMTIGTGTVVWFGALPPPDVTVTIIPEPGTLGLLGLGLFVLAWSSCPKRVVRPSPSERERNPGTAMGA